MALRSWLVVAVGLLWLACEGDSSSTIKVYGSGAPVSDGGMTTTGGTMATGGRIATGGYMATGGQSSTVSVPGGVRDTQSTQCVASTDGCLVNTNYLSCMKAFCAKNLATCYTVSSSGLVLGGTCATYAKCQMECPCDNRRGTCETKCYLDYVTTDPTCGMCMYNVFVCGSNNVCGEVASCGTGGSVASVGGTTSGMGGTLSVGGSIGGMGGASSSVGGSIAGMGGVIATGGRIPLTGGYISLPVDAGILRGGAVATGGSMLRLPDSGIVSAPDSILVGPVCTMAIQCCRTLPITVGSAAEICNVVASATESTCQQILQNFRVMGVCSIPNGLY